MFKKLLVTVLSLALITTSVGFISTKTDASTAATINSWDKIGSNGWEYFIGGSASSATYDNGTSFDDGPTFNIVKNAWWDHDFQLHSPSKIIMRTSTYKLTLKVNDQNRTDQTYWTIKLDGVQVYTTYSSKVPTVAGQDKIYEYTLDISAGKVLTVEYAQLYCSAGTKKVDLTVEDLNPPTEAPTTEEPTTAAPTFGPPTKVAAYNFVAKNLGYKIDFVESFDAASYNVYVDDAQTPITSVTSPGQYLQASVFSAYADDQLHDVYLKAVQQGTGTESEASNVAKFRIANPNNPKWDASKNPDDIPRIYIVSNSDATITKKDKTSGSFTIMGDEQGVFSCNDGGTFKLRGNSTQIAQKKPYNITMSSSHTVINGASAGKKWCLLAAAFDKSMLRNKIGMDLGKIFDNVASPKDQFIDLYLDGEYKGLYEITEPADNGRCGISYDEDPSVADVAFEMEDNDRDELMDGTMYMTTTGTSARFMCDDFEDQVISYVTEYLGGQTYDHNTHYANFLNRLNTDLSANPTTSTKYLRWKTTLNGFDQAILNHNSNEALSYIDIGSFVDMYIINEIMKTVDFQYSSVKFWINYENDIPTIHAGAIWDFDLSSGNTSVADARISTGFRCQNNKWFYHLMKNKTFKAAVQARFTEKYPEIQNLYLNNSVGKNLVDREIDEMKTALARNYAPKSEGGAGWSESQPDPCEREIYPYSYSTIKPYNQYNYKQHISYLKNWFKERVEWISNKWDISYTKTSTDLDITGYQMSAFFDDTAGKIGQRTVYQFEPKIAGQTPKTRGLVYGIQYGPNPIKPEDVVVGSTSPYVQSYEATAAGKIDEQMGDSPTADYYAMTMLSGTSLESAALTTHYYVRAYAEMQDGTYVYSNVYDYSTFDITDFLYQNSLVKNESTFNYLYTNVLKKVDSGYAEKDFNWSGTIVRVD